MKHNRFFSLTVAGVFATALAPAFTIGAFTMGAFEAKAEDAAPMFETQQALLPEGRDVLDLNLSSREGLAMQSASHGEARSPLLNSEFFDRNAFPQNQGVTLDGAYGMEIRFDKPGARNGTFSNRSLQGLTGTRFQGQ